MTKVVARSVIVFLLMLLVFNLGVKSSLAYGQPTYSLQITLNTSCSIPFQTVSSAVVSFELKNIGNETFNGVLTLEAQTDKGHSWNSVVYNISNLTANSIYRNSTSYQTIDEGLYYFTAKIESPTLSNIKLYEGSDVINEGVRVSTRASIFLHSFTEFIAIAAIVVGAIVALIVGIYTPRRKQIIVVRKGR